jgi:hypothetical protein
MTNEWVKSSYSQNGGQCVECRTEGSEVLIRDTRHREAGHLTVPAREWAALLCALRAGDLG